MHSTISVDAELKSDLSQLKADGQSWTDLLEIMAEQFDPESDEATALAAMDGRDRLKAQANNVDPDEYIQDEYGLDPSEFDDGQELNAAITETLQGGV